MRFVPFLFAALVWAQDTTNFPHLGSIIREDPRFDQLIAKDAHIEVISSGLNGPKARYGLPAKRH